MTAQTFTHNGVTFQPLESQGCFYGLDYDDKGHVYLVCVAMNADGSPDTYDGEPNVVEVTNFDERQDLLDEVNALLGTSFPMSKFPGR